MATKEEVLASVIEVINSTSSAAGISIRETKGKKIIVECTGNRPDAREALQNALTKNGIQNKEDIVKGSSELGTHLPMDLQILYKKKAGSGGMQDTTLNASITELFPCIAFLTDIDETDPNIFYQKVVSNNDPKLSCYLSGDYEAGKKFIDDAVNSTKFIEKTKNAIAIYQWIKFQNKGKRIKNLFWGYRLKPRGVPPKHPGDIFIQYEDNSMVGVSLKAGGKTTQEPKLNTYVGRLMKDAGEWNLYESWKKQSYEQFYKSIPNILPYEQYGKSPMVKVIGEFERKNPQLYEKLYNNQLEWLREKLIDFFNKNQPITKKWITSKIVGDDSKLGNVPLIVLKAFGTGVEELEDDDVVAACLGRVKPQGGIKATKSTTSKQDFNISLTCKAKTTDLNFAVRTNKVGAEHKLGQFINLALKFKGVK
jgi:hypothetical protein